MHMLCGLEIHQRLAGRKLFCPCPSPKPDEPLADDALVLRRSLRSTSGETGVTDTAAAFEQERLRTFEYRAPRAYSCLVEADEEPPHEIDASHLRSALQLAQAAKAQVADEIQVMRKTVVDGSNTSGFQRTALISFGGALSSPAGPIPLQTICLEEESAGILSAPGGPPTYRLDRLGIPLLEIATEPVFTTPQAAREGAQAIGLFLRMMPGVMRGLGTIRQDVNISIPGGARVEIKGAQALEQIPLLIENEMARQHGLIEISAELEKRQKAAQPSASLSSSSLSWIEATPLFEKTSCKIISRALTEKGVVLAAKLPLMGGLLGRTLYAGRRFGTELSDYAKAAGGVAGLIHSDEELAKYTLSPDEIEELAEALSLGEGDAFILIADARARAEPAMKAALGRAERAAPSNAGVAPFLPVPSETRKALEEGGSQFMRPISGSHRMYPETDIPTIRVHAKLLASAHQPVETLDARRARLSAMLGPELAEQMLHSHSLERFEKLVEGGADARLTAVVLEQTLISLRREGVKVDAIADSQLEELFALYKKEKITKAAISEILRAAAGAPSSSLESIVQQNSWGRVRGEKLSALWRESGGDLKSFMTRHRLVVDGADAAMLAKKKG